MKSNIFKTTAVILGASFLTLSCSSDDDTNVIPDEENVITEIENIIPEIEIPTEMELDFSGTFSQQDQMGRPAINTVFVSSSSKDLFNETIPSNQNSSFQAMFQANLEALSPAYGNDGDMNALQQDAEAFTSLLATDVLNVSLDGVTTFFDGTNLLTGRALTDDVISTELLLIFGGETGTEFLGLSDDHVDANDKEFDSSFPYLASPWL